MKNKPIIQARLQFTFRMRLFALIVGLAVCVACKDDPESSGAKSENSALQAMMLRHQSDSVSQVTFFTEMGFHFVCIPYNGRKIWVMLDAQYTPYYKQQPWNQNFSLSETDFEKIEQSKVATAIVIQCLGSHIAEEQR